MEASMETRSESSPLSREHQATLRGTWALVAPIGEQAVATFYARLFAIDPTVRALFDGVDLDQQGGKLLSAIDRTIGALDRPERLLPMLEQLGRRHAEHGVTDAHYDSVGRALLWALERGLGEAWTPQARDAWLGAYDLISTVMRHAKVDVASAIESPVTVRALDA